MKQIIILIVACLTLLAPAVALADHGVVVEATGNVKIAQKGKSAKNAAAGEDLPEGTTITTGPDGHITILFASGQIHRVLPNRTLILTTDEPIAGNAGVIRGISVALNEVIRGDQKQDVHAMVKATPKPFELTPAHKERMEKDLKQVDDLKLSTPNGVALMKAQIYYKYRQYRQALDLLFKVYRSEKEPGDALCNMIALCYVKLGNPKEAAKYRR